MSGEQPPSIETTVEGDHTGIVTSLRNGNWRDTVPAVLAKLVVLLWTAVFIFPLYYGFAGSTMTRPQLYSFPPRLLPGNMFFENYTTTLLETQFLQSMVSSLVYAIGANLGLLLICIPAGYAFATYQFRGNRTLMVLVLVFLAVPFQLISIPLFKLAVDWGLINTYAGAILPAMAAPLGLFFMRQNIKQVIDPDIINSARIDGASEFQAFYHVVAPLLKPGVLALGIYMFILRMQEYYWPLIILRQDNVQVFQVWVQGLRSAHGPSPFEIILPAGVMMTLLLLLVFFLGQKYFIQGLTQGSLKG